MSLKETKNGYQYFTYEHSNQYQQVQFQFYDAVESLDPQNIGVGYDVESLDPQNIGVDCDVESQDPQTIGVG